MVEAGGIEPPSEVSSGKGTTRLVHVLFLALKAPMNGIFLCEPEKFSQVVIQALPPTTLLFLRHSQLAGVVGSDVADLRRQCVSTFVSYIFSYLFYEAK